MTFWQKAKMTVGSSCNDTAALKFRKSKLCVITSLLLQTLVPFSPHLRTEVFPGAQHIDFHHHSEILAEGPTVAIFNPL